MAANQFVYFMDGVSKTYPGGKKVFENIRLNFLPGVKIGVVGVNGTGKSTLMRIMAAHASPVNSLSWPAMMRISVDLPVPFTPTTPIFTPGRKFRRMFSKTFLPPG